jgi:molybdopterin molybdotransferase
MAVSEQPHAAVGALLELGQARRIVLGAVVPLGGEQVELAAALGRALTEDVAAGEPVPAFDSSAMDGFAVRAEDLTRASAASPALLSVVDESRAGAPARASLAPGQAIAISTGAMLPAGADTVVRVEDTRPSVVGGERTRPPVVGGERAERAGERVEVLAAAPPGRDVRRAGDDIRAGETVLRGGVELGPAELGVLASLGREHVLCARQPRLSLLTSGDELIAVGGAARAGGARAGGVRDSNTYTISALARRAGAELVRAGTVADDAEETRAALARTVADVDVAVVCGGVSVGAHDHVRPALRALGARQELWGVALKPGRPTWFGTLSETLVFGLPGNPVSAIVTFVLLVRPALRALAGLPPFAQRATATIDSDYAKPIGRAHAVRCRVSQRADGWHAEPTGAQGSHVLTSMLGADALAILPTDSEGVRAGERVEIEWLRTPS